MKKTALVIVTILILMCSVLPFSAFATEAVSVTQEATGASATISEQDRQENSNTVIWVIIGAAAIGGIAMVFVGYRMRAAGYEYSDSSSSSSSSRSSSRYSSSSSYSSDSCACNGTGGCY